MIAPAFLRHPLLRLRAAASAFLISVLLVAIFTYSLWRDWPPVATWLIFGLLLCVVALRHPIDRLHSWSRTLLAARDQLHYDRRALRCMEAIERGEDLKAFSPIVLFLRPFAADRNLRFPNRAGHGGFDVLPIESELAARYNQWCTTVMIANAAVDRHGYWQNAFLDGSTEAELLYYVGPGEFALPTSDWFDTVKKVAMRADLVFVIPMDFGLSGVQTGTFDELEFLFSEHLIDKCIFVMPAEQSVGRVRRIDARGVIYSRMVDKPLADLWEESRQSVRQLGIELPPFVHPPPGHCCFFGWPLGPGAQMKLYILDRRHWPAYCYQWLKEYGKRR